MKLNKESTVEKVQSFHRFMGKNGHIVLFSLSGINVVVDNMDGAIYGMLLSIFLILLKRK